MGYKTSKNSKLENYKSKVELKYEMLNGLFLGLQFDTKHNSSSMLSSFTTACKNQVSLGISPVEIVNNFELNVSEEEKLEILIKFIRYIERQIVLVDALEESAYSKTHSLTGEFSIDRLISSVENKSNQEELEQAINDYHVRLVLTAHPTQFYAKLVLPIIRGLKKAITDNDINRIKDVFLQMEKTRFSNTSKPSPEDEALSIIWYLENVFYETIPMVQHKLSDSNMNIEVGFWPGGDRDGNPFVTSNVTKKVSKHLRKSILDCYSRDIKRLMNKFTFDGVYEKLVTLRKEIKSNSICSPVELINSLEKIRYVVVPLLETVKDLDNSTAFIDKLLQTDLYKDSLSTWNNSQTIMLGFF